MPAATAHCVHPQTAVCATAMPRRSTRTIRYDSLFDEVSLRLPLFEGLSGDNIQHLSALGFGRGFLTASLRARLRKAGFRDLSHLAQSSPEEIARIRKFGPVRVELIRTFILDEIAHWLPSARQTHAVAATRERRLELLRETQIKRLALDADKIAALGFAGSSCADMAGRSRLNLLGTGLVTPIDVDCFVMTLARFLGACRTSARYPGDGAREALSAEMETTEVRRAALLADQDREWEEAAPARDWRRIGIVRRV
ncbi:hypothetical protein MKK65_18300 [Methylobacterium sp. J-001]|uniref:hypothetical protein n=1 Tax=unclassified Methylobacterium TaxID=2615210 RepID=UPI000ACA5203|nr:MULTISPECIES: hypothetical protein [unclassified Methylobacterium]MCJ2118492.1 hypothetical protein [Methylobacterium sp. J-001]